MKQTNNTITVIIHTYREENNIEECIKSARLLTNDILVVDMESDDKTCHIAEKEKVRIISFPHSDYVEPAREFGIKNTESDWVFLLDADERITLELVQEIKSIIANNFDSGRFTHYKVSRKNIFYRKWLQYGGWRPDHQIRLFNKSFFKSWPKEIHSTPLINGNMGYLSKPLLHYFHGDLEQMVNKTIIFEDIESNLLFKAGRKTSTPIFFRKYLGELFRRLIMKKGYFDGSIGIIESIYQAFSKTITYLYLYEKKLKSRTV
ncbi:MAG: Glycosyl transferase family 2 [Candidatus Roizmanbacteria bacterium GW2011_GWA2_36_23]|uniref:Glycosyl transferase family 2 n=1 Tax=Candidatus Roizmanbacteria bacterium GW2011_GWA2_36_23 TaxID=1618480 RepID=A0A0G0ELL8_9BACT|nr:MAG: Glycosyl transferase family 2 [Candidatus Roizmanbacteria bacterium GW2011_GWA2_36_23]